MEGCPLEKSPRYNRPSQFQHWVNYGCGNAGVKAETLCLLCLLHSLWSDVGGVAGGASAACSC